MRRLVFRFLAASSTALVAAAWALAATRPRYGGVFQVEMTSSVKSLDPAVPASSDAEAEDKRRIEETLFDRLVRLDHNGLPVPELATSWSHDAENKTWQFSLRPDIKLANGNVLSLQDAVSSLAAANPGWHVTVSDGKLRIETNAPFPGLPAELALARNSILHRDEKGGVLGTGPFRLLEWQPGRRAILTANDDYWAGRPYVDSVEISLDRAPGDQLIDLELGKADVIELGINQLHRAMQENLRTIASAPAELLAIVFAPGESAASDPRTRQALALSIDRQAIHDILLQKQGEAAGGLLPGWLSGYAFLFPSVRDLARARKLRAALSDQAPLTLGYPASDALTGAVAQRIALDARDAGLSVRAIPRGASGGSADARLVRLRLETSDPRTALAGMARSLGEPVAELRAESAAPGEFYEIERSLVDESRVIPLFHLPEIFGVSSRVREWSVSPAGGWRPQAAWLAMENP